MYRIPVRIQGGTRQALLDSGCKQTMIHQSLVQPEALVEASWVSVRCVHGDIHDYPVVSGEIRHREKKHRVKAVVSSRQSHPLLLGIDWSGFHNIMKGYMGKRSRLIGICDVFSGNAKLSVIRKFVQQRLS